MGAAADAAVEQNLEAVADGLAITGNASTVAGTPSSCRPPWLETTMAVAPMSAAVRASATVITPLMANGPVP